MGNLLSIILFIIFLAVTMSVMVIVYFKNKGENLKRKDYKIIILILFVFILGFFIIYIDTAKRKKIGPLEGVILSHHTSSSKGGYIYYHTIIKTTKGEVKSLEGLEFFTLPVGEKIKID